MLKKIAGQAENMNGYDENRADQNENWFVYAGNIIDKAESRSGQSEKKTGYADNRTGQAENRNG